MDYFGPMVNKAARVGGSSHGCQIVTSNSSWEALNDVQDMEWTDLGWHRLKGITDSERIWQVQHRSLSGRTFPAIKTKGMEHPPGWVPQPQPPPEKTLESASNAQNNPPQANGESMVHSAVPAPNVSQSSGSNAHLKARVSMSMLPTDVPQ